jgi:squalene-hopene/tetraprenyl-beta-curcumene cyclase
MRWFHVCLLIPALLVFMVTEARAQPVTPKPPANPFPYNPDEPVAKEMSLAKAASYLDDVAGFWMEKNSCGACHANFAYLMARPALKGDTPLLAETRKFMEARQPKPKGFNFDSEAVAIAFALAWDDTRIGKKIQPTTRDALQRMWSRQKSNGRWSPLGCGDPFPAETDTRYTMTLAAIAGGIASKKQATSVEAQDGLTKIRREFDKSPPSNLHNRAMLLWASLHVDGLMTTAERKDAIEKLIAAQGHDGGWSLSGMYESRPTAQTPKYRSDGYSTGFTVYVLRQAGVPATRQEVARGLDWLRSNQRVSGRWFTPALVSETEGGVGSRDLYAQNLGTAFAVLALRE